MKLASLSHSRKKKLEMWWKQRKDPEFHQNDNFDFLKFRYKIKKFFNEI